MMSEEMIAMQETTYDDGHKVRRFGPLAEMMLAAQRDVEKDGVVKVSVAKVPTSMIEQAVAEMERKIENVRR